MPRVGFHGGIVRRLAFADHKTEQAFLDHDDDDQNDEREPAQRFAVEFRIWWIQKLVNVKRSFSGNPKRRQQKHDRAERAGKRLGLAVAVGMLLVGRLGGDDDAAPDDQRIENVRERFGRVRDERVRMAENSGGKFCRAQNDIHRDP